jgi:hypothetical protein
MTLTLSQKQTLFKYSLFDFYPVEVGCPAYYPSLPFGGTEPLLNRIATLLNLPAPTNDEEEIKLATMYIVYMLDFSSIIKNIQLAPGTYTVKNIALFLERLSEKYDMDDPELLDPVMKELRDAAQKNFSDYMTSIEVTETNLAMAKAALWHVEYQYSPFYLDSNEEMAGCRDLILSLNTEGVTSGNFMSYPIVSGDPKRPYGDLGYYYRDLETLDVPGIKADGPEKDKHGILFSDEEKNRIDQIQANLHLILQALAEHGVVES